MEKRMAKSARIPKAILFVIFAFLFIIPTLNNLSLLISNSGEGSSSAKYDYKITAYDVDVKLLENNKLVVKEQITVQHNEYMHGLVRGFPVLQTITYQNNQGKQQSLNYKVEPTRVSGGPYLQTYYDDGIFYFRFGQENDLVKGTRQYTLNYTLNIGDDRISEFDQFYYNIIGHDWDTTVSNITFKLTLFKPVEQGKQLNLYVGKYGSTNQLPPIVVDESGTVFQATFNTTLQAGEGITGRMVFPEGYLQIKRTYTVEIVLLALFAVVSILAIVFANKFSNKDQIVPVVNFTPPDNLPPSELGYVIDGIIDNKDIASLIVYWAQKGYLNIVNTAPEGKKEVLELKKVADADRQNMTEYEKDIFNHMFSPSDTVKLSDIGKKIFEQVAKAKQTIANKHEKQNFVAKFFNVRNILAFLGAACMALAALRVSLYATEPVRLAIGVGASLAVLAVNYALLTLKDKQYAMNAKYAKIGLFAVLPVLWVLFVIFTFNAYADVFFVTFLSIVPSVLAVVCSYSINYRSKQCMKLLGEILGFKQFIEFTEKDRIELLVKQEPQLFYNILPYAYVLGVSNKWISKFENIAISPPSWYQTPNPTVFDYLVIRSLFNSVMLSSTTSMSYTPKVSSGSGKGGFGGFGGGGGFSGGGFGGGGGRGW